MKLGRLALLDKFRAMLQRLVLVGPPFEAPGRGQGDARPAQLGFEEPEGLDTSHLLELTPFDPVFPVQLATLATLPGLIRLKATVPEAGECTADSPVLLQTEPAPAYERLDRGNRLLDPARPLADAGLDVKQQQIAEIPRPSREASRKRHTVLCAEVPGQRPSGSLAEPVIETPQLLVPPRRFVLQ
ncbi:MAG TPA: hypothetical protein VKM54_29580, partial [Myxococcota bacterium]|nr:hypothetical protein [Myxococcota bacterium]